LFQIDFDDYFKEELLILNQFEKDNLIEFTSTSALKDTIGITQSGKYFARHIAHLFDRHYRGNSNDEGGIRIKDSEKKGELYELSTRNN
jgi:hypothetical protein